MSKRGLLNLILLAIVIALALVIFYKPGKEKPADTRLTTIDKKDIHTIVLQRIGNPALEFKRTDKGWIMQKPYALKANAITVEALLELLAYNHHGQYNMAELNPASYGLDKPRATVTFNNTYSFDFGTTEPLNRYRYIRYNNKLNLTDDYYFHRILGDATTFLDYGLLPDDSRITALSLPDLKFTQQDGAWSMQPAADSFSNDQVNELMENWQHAHASEISPYDPASQKHQGQVEIQLQQQDKPLIFTILIIDNDFYLGRPDLKLKYKLAGEKRRDLLQLPSALEKLDTLPLKSATEQNQAK